MPAALVGDRALFIHFPKTGGSWATHAMRGAGVELRPFTVHHPTLEGLPGYQDRFRFGFVRHPLTWWQSYWRYRMERGWDPGHVVDSQARAEQFEAFAANVVERVPGYLSEKYSEFLGPPEDEIEFIGRFEQLADDLVTALKLAGEPFDELLLRKRRPI